MKCKSMEDAQRVLAMCQTEGWIVVRDAIEEEIAFLTEQLIMAKGGESEMRSYQSMIRAFRMVLTFVDNRVTQVEKGGN